MVQEGVVATGASSRRSCGPRRRRRRRIDGETGDELGQREGRERGARASGRQRGEVEQGGQGEGFEARPYPLHVDGRRRVDERPVRRRSATVVATARRREGERRERGAGWAGWAALCTKAQPVWPFPFSFSISFLFPLFAKYSGTKCIL